jgi:hypothetical protein
VKRDNGKKIEKIMCFDGLVAGAGMLSDHCFDQYRHGRFAPGKDTQKEAWYNEGLPDSCLLGMGSTLRRFSEHMRVRAGKHLQIF